MRQYWLMASRTIRKLPLLTHTIARMVAEDPLLFAVQTSRRLPKRLRARLAPSPSASPSLAVALAAFIGDQPDHARDILRRVEEQRDATSRLEAELRTQLGLRTDSSPSPVADARGAWADGNITATAFAAGHLPRTLAQRFAGEERVHRVGNSIVLRPTALPPASEVSVFHLLTNSLPWTRSGYTYRSQAVLSAQQEVGIQVHAATRLAYPTLIGRPWAAEADTVEGVTYQRLEPRRLPAGTDQRLVLQAEMFKKLVVAAEPGVLQTTTNFHNALSVDAVARSTGLPWVYEMRGNMEQSWIARQPADRREELLQSERYLSVRGRETEMAGRADHVVVLSSTQKTDLVERGIVPDKISIIPNSVDSDLLSLKRDPLSAQQALGLPSGFWVGSVTAVVSYEGLPTLLEAVALLRRKGLPVMTAIVGDGVALPGLRTLVRELGIQDAVLMPGRVLPEEALQWYSALDVFTIPRVDSDVTRSVTPMKGLQAMALGVPLIVSDLPALVEVGASRGQGLVVPPDDPPALADAIASLAADPDMCDRLSLAGRVSAAEQTWDTAADRYRDIYESLLVL